MTATSTFYATEQVELTNIPHAEPAPQPTRLEIDAFVTLLADISRRMLSTDTGIEAA